MILSSLNFVVPILCGIGSFREGCVDIGVVDAGWSR